MQRSAASYHYLRPDTGGRSTVFGSKGAVACEHPLAALAGIRTLDAGGNAADACVAMGAAMGVVAPMAAGMGGDAFLLYCEAASGRVLGLNGSGRAPANISIEALRERGLQELPQRGALTVTVPGEVRMWEDANDALGRLPLSALLEPARELAQEGFPVSEVVARHWELYGKLLAENGAAAEAFLPEGRSPKAGETFRHKDLAATLSAVSQDGSDAFYKGEVAQRIADSVQEAGGYLSEDDLASHASSWGEPISTNYRGVKVFEIAPQGVAVLEMLNILEGFDVASLGSLSAERVHLEVEAKKLAFRDLLDKAGDPEFVEVPLHELLSSRYTSELRDRVSQFSAESLEPTGGGDTTYLCAVDGAGNGCSYISSLYMGFGSGVVADGTGVVLQNRGLSFRPIEGHPNALAPRKRPLHTNMPGLATKDGRLWATFGVMGGPMQPQGHLQLLLNLVDYGMGPQEAVDHPRHFHGEGAILVEGRFPEEEVEKLRAIGHRVDVVEDYAAPQGRMPPTKTGAAQLIRLLDNGVRACGSDPRKDGCALAQ